MSFLNETRTWAARRNYEWLSARYQHPQRGTPPLSTVDGLLAATALVHDLTFVTRNVQHVAHTGAKLLNPFDSSAEQATG